MCSKLHPLILLALNLLVKPLLVTPLTDLADDVYEFFSVPHLIIACRNEMI